MFREAFAGYIKSRPMIDRSANERQPEGNINRLAKREAFNGNHRLIVITGDYCIEFAPRGPQENGVGGKGALNVYLVGSMTGFDRRGNFNRLFNPKQSAFRTMRIEGGDGNSRAVRYPSASFRGR